MRNHNHLLACGFQMGLQTLCCAYRNGCDQNQDLPVIAEVRNLQGKFFNALAGIFSKIDDLRALHHRLQMRGVHQSSRAYATADYVTEVLFMKGEDTAGQEGCIDGVTAISSNRNAKISETRSYYCAQISAPVNSDLHISLLRERCGRLSAGEARALANFFGLFD